MHRALEAFLVPHSLDLVHLVDVSALPRARAAGCTGAVLLGMALSPGFLLDVYHGRPTLQDEYLQREQTVEALADRLAEWLQGQGFLAVSQSEAGNLARGQSEGGYIDPALRCGPSLVPQKQLARLAGLGFIGRNNLLVSERYGCGVALCSVLTDAPLPFRVQEPVPSRCGDCDLCVRACPTGALLGGTWSPEGGRAALLDISRCACPLQCMVRCPFTLRYARGA